MIRLDQALHEDARSVDAIGIQLADLDDLFDVVFEASRYETVGGLVLTLVGDVPETGCEVEAEGLQFTVLSLDGRRIESVRVQSAPSSEPMESAETPEPEDPASGQEKATA